MSPGAGTRVVGYVRRSRAPRNGEPSGASLEAQRAEIERACEYRGWELVEVFEDDDRSGKRGTTRPGLAAAEQALRDGRASALVSSKLDRLSRSVVDFGLLLERAKAEGWAVVCLDIDLDMTKSFGRMVAGILVNVAEFERERIAERTREGLAVKKAQGIVPGPKADPIASEVARIVRRLVKRGEGLSAIAAELNGRGLRTARGNEWQATQVKRLIARLT